MKYIILFLLIPFFGFSQGGTWPVKYGDSDPSGAPSAAGTRLYFNTATNTLFFWEPAPSSTWRKQPKAFDQISGCAEPAYTPTARQSTFAVNSCTVPELYQWTGAAWVQLNAGATYTAGTGIAISGGNEIANTGDLSATNELNTALTVTGGNLRVTDAGGNLDVSVSSIAPVQAVAAGTGISISGTTTRTVTNSAPDQTVVLNSGTGISATGTYPNFTVTNTAPNSNDSALVKIDGSYANKRISDNIYKNGTLGLRTTDTTGVLSISNGNSASAKIAENIRPGGPYLKKVQKDALSDSPVTGDYYEGRSYSDSGSTAGENQVYNGGINYSPGGGHVERYANAVGWGLENNFKNSPSEKGEPGFGYYEMQWPEVVYSDTVQGSDGVKRATGVSNNTKRRMITGYASNQRPSYGGYFGVCSDQMPIADWKTGTPKAVWTFAENMPNPKGFDFLDTTFFRMNKNNAGGFLWANAAQNAFLGLFKVDASNRVVIGYNNVNTLYTEAQTFNSIGPLSIIPLASQSLTLGATATTSSVDIATVSAMPLTVKTSVNTSGYGFLANNSEFGIRDLSTNADMILLSKGTPAGAIWSRAPSGNIGIGGFPASDIPLEVKKSSQAVTGKLFGITNTSGTSILYRSNAAPSVGSAGDITMTNISGVGDVWVHDGTANRLLARVIKGTAALNFSSISAGNSADLTITVSGAVVGDPVSVAPGATDANSCVTAWVSATNTVTVRFNNYSASPIDPASGTFNVIVTKY